MSEEVKKRLEEFLDFNGVKINDTTFLYTYNKVPLLIEFTDETKIQVFYDISFRPYEAAFISGSISEICLEYGIDYVIGSDFCFYMDVNGNTRLLHGEEARQKLIDTTELETEKERMYDAMMEETPLEDFIHC